MRQLISICLIFILAGSASAHTLSAEAGLFAQLFHQLSGSHHWPIYLSGLVVGLLVSRAVARARKLRHRSTRIRLR